MIDKFKIAKALIDQAIIVTAANSYELVTNGQQNFEPDVNQSHIEESVLYGDDNSVGLSDLSSDIQVGIYQLSIHVPKTESKWTGLSIATILQTSFAKGLELTFDSQTVRIKNSSVSAMMTNDTHLINHLSIEFSVIA